MEFITTPYTIEDIQKLHDVGVNTIVVGTNFFSLRCVTYFSLEEYAQIREITNVQSMKMYVLINRFFVEEELKALKEHLAFLKDLGVDGIYYGDESVLYEATQLDMQHLLIYNPDTLITNKEDVAYYLEEGIQMVTLSKEITLEEMCEIARNVKGKCEVMIHGRLNMMHSKRHLLSNYSDFLGKQENLKDCRDIYIMEETRDEHMPIMEDEAGTHVFTGFTLSSFDEIKDLRDAGIACVKIDGMFHTIEYLCEVIKLYKDILEDKRNGRKTYEEFKAKYPKDNVSHGFYYTKTSKVK